MLMAIAAKMKLEVVDSCWCCHQARAFGQRIQVSLIYP